MQGGGSPRPWLSELMTLNPKPPTPIPFVLISRGSPGQAPQRERQSSERLQMLVRHRAQRDGRWDGEGRRLRGGGCRRLPLHALLLPIGVRHTSHTQTTEKLTHRSTSHMWQFSAERGVFIIRQLVDFYFKRAFGAEASKALIIFNKLRSR